jgi:pentose-5-phosphate-3-epimerase
MTSQQLAPWHRGFPGLMAGSVYAAKPPARVAAARALSAAGLDVHVDIMADSEGLPIGVSLAELRDIACAVERARIGVHLIGSAEFVDRILPEILPFRPATVFLPWAAFTEERAGAIRTVGSAAWIALWNEWDGVADPRWPAAPDGALVMLIEPGTRDSCALARLGIVAACSSEMRVAVDGGITEDIAPLCVTAGVQSMVVGRALLLDLPPPGRLAPGARGIGKETMT